MALFALCVRPADVDSITMQSRRDGSIGYANFSPAKCIFARVQNHSDVNATLNGLRQSLDNRAIGKIKKNQVYVVAAGSVSDERQQLLLDSAFGMDAHLRCYVCNGERSNRMTDLWRPANRHADDGQLTAQEVRHGWTIELQCDVLVEVAGVMRVRGADKSDPIMTRISNQCLSMVRFHVGDMQQASQCHRGTAKRIRDHPTSCIAKGRMKIRQNRSTRGLSLGAGPDR